MQGIFVCRKLNKVFVFGYLIVLGIIYNTMKGNFSMSSMLIGLSFIYVFGVFISKVTHGQIKKTYINILFISCTLVFLNTTLSGPGGFDYYKKAIMYTATIVWLMCSTTTTISPITVKAVIVINLIINVLYLYFFRQGFSVYEGEVLLTLNFPNPNQTGMFILNSILYICISIIAGQSLANKKWHYIIMLCVLIPLLVAVCQLLFMTGCRSSFMSLALFVVLVILDYTSMGHFKLKKWMTLVIAIMPFVFVFIYLSNVGDFSTDVSMGIENAGKSSMTRVSVWKPIVTDFWHYFMIGDYYGISNGTGMSQLHNTHLDVYASYGFIPLVLYITILYKVIRHSAKFYFTRFQRVSLYAFVACMVSCTFEACFVAGSAGLFLLTIGFLVLANSNLEANDFDFTKSW